MVFWILITFLSVVAMGFVCYPLLRNNVIVRSEVDSEQTLYKARLLEIDKDLELGRLDETSAKAARAEEARRLIKSSEKTRSLNVSPTNKLLVIVAALSLPIFALPFYLSIGSPKEALPSGVVAETNSEPSIEDLLTVAEKRLASNPDDTNGWKVVAPVYMRMGRFNDAINAYENVLRVEGDSAEFLLKLADVHIEQNQGQFTDTAQDLVSRVLEIDTENAVAKFYTGIIALQNDKPDETRQIWQAMLDTANGDEDWVPIIQRRIAELNSLEQTPSRPTLDEATIEAAKNMSAEDRVEMIGQMVESLSDRLQENPNDKQGWQRLVQSYIVLNRNEEAQEAFENASRQFSGDEIFIEALRKIITTGNSSSNGEKR